VFYQTEGIQCFIRQRVFSVLSDREYSVFYQTESIQCFIRQRVFSVLSDRVFSGFSKIRRRNTFSPETLILFFIKDESGFNRTILF
jgi:hypothetical protein